MEPERLLRGLVGGVDVVLLEEQEAPLAVRVGALRIERERAVGLIAGGAQLVVVAGEAEAGELELGALLT